MIKCTQPTARVQNHLQKPQNIFFVLITHFPSPAVLEIAGLVFFYRPLCGRYNLHALTVRYALQEIYRTVETLAVFHILHIAADTSQHINRLFLQIL